jgi:lysyl-tRNA synthetase class 2
VNLERVFCLQRHPRGPRVFLLGRRVHEWQLGVAILGVLAIGRVAGWWGASSVTILVALLGAWLLAKDWRDVSRSGRDTSSWRLGIHRPAHPLRAARRAEGLPTLAAAVALTIGLVNLASALTPNVAWRGRLLLQLEPVEVVPLFHTLAVPASVALLVAAFYLARRRRRARQAAFVLLVVLGALNLLKGLDFEEALISWAGAALLWWGRDAFHVRHDPLRRTALLLPAALYALAGALAVGVVWATAPIHPGLDLVGRETADLLAWREGPVSFRDDMVIFPLLVGGLSLAGVVAAVYVLFRPLSALAGSPDARERRAAVQLVRAHGADTLDYFKLRTDLHYLFSPDRRAFVGYRLQGSVMVIAGDPIGAPDALPEVVRAVLTFAEERGLRLVAIGAGERGLHLYGQAGLRSLYIGDEAIVETDAFSLEGRPIRKVRQSVARLTKVGYCVRVHELESIDDATARQLARVWARGRGEAAERGFSMALDSLGMHQADSVVVAAHDAEGQIRGFLHFVPAYGRKAMSLSCMRRERDTPNGLTEFLVVRSIEQLRERGVEEVSLNFAAFARVMQQPRNARERVLGRALALANPFFQIESLYRFNAKFFPRWEPRYLVYESILALPRVGLAALLVEGQLPSPRRTLAHARA